MPVIPQPDPCSGIHHFLTWEKKSTNPDKRVEDKNFVPGDKNKIEIRRN
jgi:hypothetical protein